MTTTLKSGPSRNDVAGSSEDNSLAGCHHCSEAELERFLTQVYGERIPTSPRRPVQLGILEGKTGLLRAVAGALRGVQQLLSGPPMTGRDRNHQAMVEAQARAGMLWTHRAFW